MHVSVSKATLKRSHCKLEEYQITEFFSPLMFCAFFHDSTLINVCHIHMLLYCYNKHFSVNFLLLPSVRNINYEG